MAGGREGGGREREGGKEGGREGDKRGVIKDENRPHNNSDNCALATPTQAMLTTPTPGPPSGVSALRERETVEERGVALEKETR